MINKIINDISKLKKKTHNTQKYDMKENFKIKITESTTKTIMTHENNLFIIQ